MLIVKLGGSLRHSASLPAWLACLAARRDPAPVIVPGGGGFAHEVRRFQQRWWTPDAHADALARESMVLFGHCLLGLAPALRGFRAPDTALPPGPAGIWLPSGPDASPDPLPASWAVSSDSMALWLAGLRGVRELVLVKHLPEGPTVLDGRDPGALPLLDRHFPVLLAESTLKVTLLSQAQPGLLDGFLPPGCP